MKKKVKDLNDKLTNAWNDLWSTDELLRLTRNQLEVSEQSLRVALERGAQHNKTTSMALATNVMFKDESTQELSQAKDVIDAQRLENFFLMQELMALKAELESVNAQMVTGTTVKTIFVTTEMVQAPPPPVAHQDLPDTRGR